MKTDFNTTPDGVYRLHDFLRLYDKDFINAAYAAIMKRKPEPDEEISYLRKIRNGVSRERILDQLAGSEEARNNEIEIRGLQIAVFLEKLKNIPVLGTLLICAHFVCSSRRVFKRMRAVENRIYRIEAELVSSCERWTAHLQLLSDISKRHDLVKFQDHDLENLIMSLPLSLRKITRDISEIKYQLEEVPHVKGLKQKDNGI